MVDGEGGDRGQKGGGGGGKGVYVRGCWSSGYANLSPLFFMSMSSWVRCSSPVTHTHAPNPVPSTLLLLLALALLALPPLPPLLPFPEGCCKRFDKSVNTTKNLAMKSEEQLRQASRFLIATT